MIVPTDRRAAGRAIADLAAALLDLTQRQVDAAERGDWEAAHALLAQRAPLATAIATVDATTLDHAGRARLATVVATVLGQDRQLAQLMEANRSVIRHELARVRRGRRLLGVYRGARAGEAGRLVDRPS